MKSSEHQFFAAWGSKVPDRQHFVCLVLRHATIPHGSNLLRERMGCLGGNRTVDCSEVRRHERRRGATPDGIEREPSRVTSTSSDREISRSDASEL